MEPLLDVRHLTKRFGRVVANDDVSFAVAAGEIHCLLGENGAGKSTLVESLFGYYRPDAGHIRVDGREVRIDSPAAAIALGIGMVHQHFVLIEPFTVLENVVLGTSDLGVVPDYAAARGRVAAAAARAGISLDIDRRVSELAVGERQQVELLKALYHDVRLLVLDEPTAVLTPFESAELFRMMRRLVGTGSAVVLITHKLDEVLQCDSVTILRRGRVVSTQPVAATHGPALAAAMVGRELKPAPIARTAAPGARLLEVAGLQVHNDRGAVAVADLSLTLHRHEILGLAGVAGNGQRELFEALAGTRPPRAGEIRLDGNAITLDGARARLRAGIGHVPQDRYAEALIGELSIAENLLLGAEDQPPFARFGWLDSRAIERFAQQLVADYGIECRDVHQPVAELSGGNAQKVVLAREVAQSGKVLLAHHPLRGLDLGVVATTKRRLLAMREAGFGILLALEDLNELIELSDRIAVISGGRIAAVFSAAEATLDGLGLAMAGGRGSSAQVLA